MMSQTMMQSNICFSLIKMFHIDSITLHAVKRHILNRRAGETSTIFTEFEKHLFPKWT